MQLPATIFPPVIAEERVVNKTIIHFSFHPESMYKQPFKQYFP